MDLFSLIPAYRALLTDVRRQKSYVREVLEHDIREAKKDNDGSLDEEDFQKIRGYYGFGVPAIVGEGFCTLRGKAMGKKERLANSCQGALTGLYDDFFDKTNVDTNDILEMMADPAGYEATTSLERLFIHFLKRVHENLPDANRFNLAFQKVFEAQVETGQQLNESTSFDQIREITCKKGGHSLLFYRSVFEHAMSEAERDALYHVGALMQLGNDIFDVWKDEPQQIKTLVTTCRHIDEVRSLFNEQLKKSISLLYQTGFPKKNIHRYLHKLLLGISRCWVCMEQLERLESKTDGFFTPSEYSRDEMVCDMEKPGNMLKSIRYYLSYSL